MQLHQANAFCHTVALAISKMESQAKGCPAKWILGRGWRTEINLAQTCGHAHESIGCQVQSLTFSGAWGLYTTLRSTSTPTPRVPTQVTLSMSVIEVTWCDVGLTESWPPVQQTIIIYHYLPFQICRKIRINLQLASFAMETRGLKLVLQEIGKVCIFCCISDLLLGKADPPLVTSTG